jgi:predicted RNase H-like HicB family nuclease
MKQFKIVIEKHPDGYVAYPIGVVGAVVGQGDTYEEALADVKSALACYIEVFGKEILDDTPSVTPLVMPNHSKIKSGTLRAICTQVGISREDFLNAYNQI